MVINQQEQSQQMEKQLQHQQPESLEEEKKKINISCEECNGNQEEAQPHCEPENSSTGNALETKAEIVVEVELEVESGEILKRKKSVQFEVAEIVEFEPTVWTATVSSGGVPLGMSTKVRRRTRRRLDSFEVERRFNRVSRQEYMENGYIEPEERLDILEGAGHSVSAINLVEKEVNRINRERWESNEYDLHYQYGLGEMPLLEEEDDEIEDSLYGFVDEDEEADIVMKDYEGLDYYNSSRSMLMDAEVRFAMEEIDCYDNTKYSTLCVDYGDECTLGSSSEHSTLSYEPLDVSGTDDLSSSPSDISTTPTSTDCMIVSCSGQVVGTTNSDEKKKQGLSPSSPSQVDKSFCF